MSMVFDVRGFLSQTKKPDHQKPIGKLQINLEGFVIKTRSWTTFIGKVEKTPLLSVFDQSKRLQETAVKTQGFYLL